VTLEQAELERWQDIDQPKRIKIIVEDGEQAAAFKLVQCLYTECLPDIHTSEDLIEVLGILTLADQYQAEAALSMCVQKLEMMTDLGVITWELAGKVMQLPAAYLEKPGFCYLLTSIQVQCSQLQWTGKVCACCNVWLILYLHA
jgi:hypothetical protein